MATYNIPIGDTTPVLEISMKEANSDPVEYWDGTSYKADGVNTLPIHSVKFTLKNKTTGEIIVDRAVGTFDQDGARTILRYAWQKADVGWPADPNAFPGDTGIAGTYLGEFEVWFQNQGDPLLADRKRTFPSTPGDELIINITEDLNGI
jgi:hypothetical protein